MSDLADRIFKELIAIQVTNSGDIPPDKGIAKIRELISIADENLAATWEDCASFPCENSYSQGRTDVFKLCAVQLRKRQ